MNKHEPSPEEQVAAWQAQWEPPPEKSARPHPFNGLHDYTPPAAFVRFTCPHCGRPFSLLPHYARQRAKGGKVPCCSRRCGQLHRAARKRGAT